MRHLMRLFVACTMMACISGPAGAAEEALMNDTLKTIFARKSVRT